MVVAELAFLPSCSFVAFVDDWFSANLTGNDVVLAVWKK
jgi:hypothetical protein